MAHKIQIYNVYQPQLMRIWCLSSIQPWASTLILPIIAKTRVDEHHPYGYGEVATKQSNTLRKHKTIKIVSTATSRQLDTLSDTLQLTISMLLTCKQRQFTATNTHQTRSKASNNINNTATNDNSISPVHNARPQSYVHAKITATKIVVFV